MKETLHKIFSELWVGSTRN